LGDCVELGDIRASYDVVVVGAGPAGCACAAFFSKRGASVLLVEANPHAARRFAGEWIHPEGVRILRDLGLLDGLEGAVPVAGFAVFPNDGLGAIELPYASAQGLACEHETLVSHLRRRVSAEPLVDYTAGIRARVLDGTRVALTSNKEACEAHCGRIVVAAGRSTRDLVPAFTHDRVSISSMAGLIVSGGTLPFDGFGHVIVGGPGPALAYRISKERVRLCFDVPHTSRPRHDARRWIWQSFGGVIPRALREDVRRALGSAPLHWASNTFRPRRYSTDAGVALVGDAAGVFHPLTAMGITMSLLDAEALSEAPDLDAYGEQRAEQSYVPELLSNAIYQAFVRNDTGSLAIREAIYSTWRESPTQRHRTMRLLGGASTRRSDFLRAFSRVAFRAGTTTVRSDPTALGELVDWLRWPLASVHPNRGAMRTRSTSWATPEAWETVRTSSTGPRGEEQRHAN